MSHTNTTHFGDDNMAAKSPTLAHADAQYGVSRWGDGLITILDNGHIGLLHPNRPDDVPTDLMSVIENLDARGIAAPILL